MTDRTNARRIEDLEAALKRAKPKDTLRLEDLALLWGVTKPRFVTVRNTMADFPPAMPGEGNTHIYPARAALGSMIAHATRHHRAAAEKQARTDAILGKGRRGIGEATAAHTPSELATLNRLSAAIEEREREQGCYVPFAEVAQLASEIFSEFSDFCSTFANRMDPHGQWAPQDRRKADEMARALLLRLHKKMRHMLVGHADDDGSRAAPGGAGQPRARRQRAPGVRKQAR